jgi:hypothetical protein
LTAERIELHVPADPKHTWPDAIPESRLSREERLAEERLAFTDRIIGLEQQLKELRKESLASPSETVAMETKYAAIDSSLGQRIARVGLLPKRVLRRVKRRVLG